MCGIVGVVQGESTWEPVDLAIVVADLEAAHVAMPADVHARGLVEQLHATAERTSNVEAALRGVRGALALAASPQTIPLLAGLLDDIWRRTQTIERALDEGALPSSTADLEIVNAAIVRLKDLVWSSRRDHLAVASSALDLAGAEAGPHTVALFGQIEIALRAIDRIEVRGRDSAGVAIVVRDHGLDLDAPAVRALWERRASDPLLESGAVRIGRGNLCFVYKAAAEVGELGDNTRAIRDEIRSDALLHMALASDRSRALVLGHTRWASVGMISEPNAHPLAGDEVSAGAGPVVLAALNGDIDNHADIAAAEDLAVPVEITTDAKIIPVLVSRRLREGLGLEEAFRQTVASFEGSVAIAAVSLDHPDRLLLALRGSGQGLYIGGSRGGWFVASEPYGVVEQAPGYLRMDGESPSDPNDPSSRGQIVVLSEPAPHHDAHSMRRMSYSGAELAVTDADIRSAEITTRDVDRGPHEHFLLKEMLESPTSFRKTLRGRVVERDGALHVELGPQALPDVLSEKLRSGAIKRIEVIGQGTAAIAGRAVASAIKSALDGSPITVDAVAATELSGFGLRDDMSDTLVIAISQSGTTADTNRTVEVVRARGAFVLSIVNRRQSDLTDRSHGVLYTSDGRDVEMAVPSTKAFYAQVAAGFLLAAALAEHVGGATGVDGSVLEALRDLPDAMEHVLAQRSHIAEVAQRHVPARRDWAVVGNGANRIAAEEVRIKLSELCYKSISCDVTEDKKHIDLSAEPLILVCAAGLDGSNAEDAAKEVVYYRAHKAAPIVIHGEGEGRYDAALDVIVVPHVHPAVAFVLSTMAGHVFGYEAALAIDALAKPLREARTAVESATEVPAGNARDPLALLGRVRAALVPLAGRFHEGLRAGTYDGHLDPSVAVRIASLFRYATGMSSLDAYQIEYGKVGTPTEVLRDLLGALTAGIDKLTRPVDAIRHQAKTVTVGISRAEETLLQVGLVREVLSAGVARDRLSYRSLRALAALDPSIDRVAGYTLYRVEGDVASDEALIRITDRGGISNEIPSRTDRDPRLRGTKHRVAVERDVLVTRGHDGRTLVMVPEVKGAEVTGIVLLHVRFHDRLPADVMRGVLQGYRDRYSALRDLVTETEPTFRDDLLASIDVSDLLIESIQVLARRWRTAT
jgi:glucosamine--fructose-6-phosphate aminotransferase (isomerizing)